jgi:hypothetical protein
MSASVSLVMAGLMAACGGGGGGSSTPAAQSVTAPTVAAADPAPSAAPVEAAPVTATTATTTTTATTATTTTTATTAVDATKEQPLATSSDTGLDPGTGSATLSWNRPVTNADGSAVGALAGYVIHYGPASGQYIASLYIADGSAAGGTVTGLASGTWYFSVSALDASGNESEVGYEMSKTF